MALYAQGERFEPLQKEERMPGAERCACVAQQYGANTRHISRSPSRLCKNSAVVARVRLGQAGKFSGDGPVEFAAVHNHAADSRTVPANEFRCRMHDNIRAIFDWPKEVWGGKGVIHNQGNAVCMRDLCNAFYIRHIGIWVAQ